MDRSIVTAVIVLIVTIVVYMFEQIAGGLLSGARSEPDLFTGGRSHNRSKLYSRAYTPVGHTSGIDYDSIPLIARTIDELIDLLNGKYPNNAYKKLLKLALETHDMSPSMTLDDITHRLEYVRGCKFVRTSTHNGQIKLGASEIRFLTIYTTPDTKADPRIAGNYVALCVYAGAAPSNKHGILHRMFPRVKFLFIDPNPFEFHGCDPESWIVIHDPTGASKQKIHGLSENALIADGIYDGRALLTQALNTPHQTVVINDLFINDLADAIGEMIPGALFVSDIRTNHRIGDNPQPDAVDILWNFSQQFNWVRKMKSSANMTKFRHPFYGESDGVVEKGFAMPYISADMDLAMTTINDVPGIDFRANYRDGKKLVWFDGVVDLQVFAPWTSTETRLRFDGKKTRDWGMMNDYENAFFAHNNTMRPFARCLNPNADHTIGFDLCSDCAGLNRILTDYYAKFHRITNDDELKRKVITSVKQFMRLTDRSLFRDSHGYLFDDGVNVPRLYDAALRYSRADGKNAPMMMYPDKKLNESK